MEIKVFNRTEDYDTVSAWWKQREHAQVPQDFISDYGFIAFENGNAVAAMWLYPVVTTKWCMIRFPISDPNSTNELRSQALDLIFDTIHLVAKDMGYKHIFCTTNHPGLQARLNKCGYTLEFSDCAHFWGEL